MLCCLIGNDVICEVTSVELLLTLESGIQLNFTKGKTKCFLNALKLLVFKTLCGVILSSVTICFDIGSFYISKASAARNCMHRHKAEKQTEIFFTFLDSWLVTSRLWCNGWMRGSSLSLKFPFSSTAFVFTVSPSNISFVQWSVGQECTSIRHSNNSVFCVGVYNDVLLNVITFPACICPDRIWAFFMSSLTTQFFSFCLRLWCVMIFFFFGLVENWLHSFINKEFCDGLWTGAGAA